jgi:hypothetical protein
MSELNQAASNLEVAQRAAKSRLPEGALSGLSKLDRNTTALLNTAKGMALIASTGGSVSGLAEETASPRTLSAQMNELANNWGKLC